MSNTIFDITTTEPKSDDVFFVDTNVWYWLTYASSKTFLNKDQAPSEYQTTLYPDFIQKALNVSAKLYYSPLSLAELANTIENIEFGIFEMFNINDGKRIHRKQFRKIAKERKGVVQEVEAAWDTIASLANSLDCELTEKLSEASMEIFKSSNLDPYDAFFIEIMRTNNLTKIITDDADFGSTTGLQIFTANSRLNSQ